MDDVADSREVCGSLIQLFEFQRADVIWNAHHRKLMGFLGQKWKLRQCDRKKRKGSVLLMAEEWEARIPRGKPPSPIRGPLLPPRECPREPSLWASLAGNEKAQSVAYSSGSQEFSSIQGR